jgi:hypothetical protein
MSGPVENVSENSLNKLLFLLFINGLFSNEHQLKRRPACGKKRENHSLLEHILFEHSLDDLKVILRKNE